MVSNKPPSILLVVLAFAAVYIIWGSTYFFIEMAVKHLPPMVLGALRFMASGLIMLIMVIARGEKIWDSKAIISSVISGLLLLFVGNGGVIWVEQYLHSSFVAIFLASAPLWFLVFDRSNWKLNFSNPFTLAGIAIGMLGVTALFYEKVKGSIAPKDLLPLLVLCIANIGWVLGSLYSKYKVHNISPSLNSAWQMLSAGLAFALVGGLKNDFSMVDWSLVPAKAWLAIVYLIIFGSIIGYSAYVFLLKFRSATQVSTYAYVNPLVAVLLGVFINHDQLTKLQISGLVIILCSVFFISLAKKRREKILQKQQVLH